MDRNIMKKQNLTLPEWAFLDGATHLGNTLEGRDILLHIRTHTMLEVFAIDDLELHLNSEVKKKKFTYKNRFGITEKHCFVIHYSVAEFANLDEVLDKAVKFYTDYLTWEDNNIIDEHTAKHN